MILALFVDAANHLEPDEESLAIYERWAGRSFEDYKREAFEKSRDEYEERIREMFGIDIDLSQYDESDESFARFNRELEDRMANVETEDTPARKQTQKQIEAEQRNMMLEHRRKLSLRSVYLGLVKALHPDIAIDAAEGKRRDDLMKRVTVAYKQGDLQTLLRIEMTEVERDVDTLDTLPDDTLNNFIDSLKQQKAQLSCELRDLYHHPRYAHIRPFTVYGVDGATDLLDNQAKEYKRDIRMYDELLSRLSETTPRHILIRIVEDVIAD